jgi:cobalt-zinc-cadmium efflux system outer membrane protein
MIFPIVLIAALSTCAIADPSTQILPTPVIAQPTSATSSAPDLTLQQAISQALSANADILAANRQYDAAKARVAQAIDQGHPTISFNSQASESNVDVGQPPPSHETFGAIQNSITVPIPIGRKPRLAVAQASAQLDAAMAQLSGVRITVTNQIITTFYDLLRKQALLRDAQFSQSEAQRQLDEAQKRNMAGDVPEIDVIRSQIPVSTADSEVIQAQTDVLIAEEALNAAIGRDIDTPLSAQDVQTLPDLTTISEPQARALAQQRSTDVQTARAKITEEDAAIETSKLWREPQLYIQALDTRSGDITSFPRQDTIQASVTVPLSDSGLSRDQRREAEATMEQAKQQLSSAILAASASASAAYQTAVSAGLQTHAAKQSLDTAQSAYDKIVIGYQNGLFPLTDVLSAQATLIATKNAYTQAFYNAQSSAALLEALIGFANFTSGVK